MNLILTIILWFILIIPSFAEVISITNFKGMADSVSADRLADGYSPNMLNVVTDEEGIVKKRTGYIPYNTTVTEGSQSITKMYKYTTTSGIDYMIANTSCAVYYSKGDGSMNLVSTQSLNSNYIDSYTTAIGRLYRDNGYDVPAYWDTSTYTEVTPAISTGLVKGKYQAYWNNRLWKGGVATNPNVLYYSEMNSPNDFGTTGENYVNLNVNDGDEITSLFIWNNRLIATKKKATWEIIETQAGVFINKCLSAKVGCLYHTTIDELNGYPIWVSDRGIERFNGSNFELLSEPIDTYIKSLPQLTYNSKNWIQTTGSDFSSGTCVNCTTSSVSGEVTNYAGLRALPSSINTGLTTGLNPQMAVDSKGNPHIAYWDDSNYRVKYASQTEDLDWKVSTARQTSSLTQFSVNDLDLFNDKPYITYSYSGLGVWVASYSYINNTWYNVATEITDGYKPRTAIKSNGDIYCVYLTYPAYDIYFASMSANKMVWQTGHKIWDGGSLSRADIYIDYLDKVHIVGMTAYDIYYTTFTAASDTGFINHLVRAIDTPQANSNVEIVADSNGRPHIAYQLVTGTAYGISYASATWASDLNKPTIWTTDISSYQTSGGGAIGDLCNIAISSENITYLSWLDTENFYIYYTSQTIIGGKFALPTTLSSIASGASYNDIAVDSSNVHIAFYNTSVPPVLYYKRHNRVIPSFTSQVFNADSLWTSWGTFGATDNTDLTYYARTSTSSYSANYGSYFSVTDKYQILNATGSYIQIKAEFPDSNSILSDFTVNYFENKPLNPYGIVYRDAYYLAVATGTSSTNNEVLVFQKNGYWTRFDNMSISSMLVFQNKSYFGNYTGSIFNFNVDGIYRDNATAYNSYWTSKIYDGGAPLNNKLFTHIWTTTNNDGNYNLDLKYRLDGSTSSYTSKIVSLNNGYGYVVSKTPLPLATKGKYIQFQIGNNAIDEYYNFKRLDCIYGVLPLYR